MLLGMSLIVAMSVGPVELDQVRITAHLKQTEADLRARDVSHLTSEQREARAENLDALHRYWVRGVYPQNTTFPRARVPVFIDDAGRACAVGQLMIDSGSELLAQHIALDERLEYLATIETEGVGAWIAESGLTFAELARIQPAYCGCSNEPLEPVCGEDGETYPNPCMATQCAGVEIEHEGPCAGNSESGNGVTEGATTGEEPGSSTGTTTATTSTSNAMSDEGEVSSGSMPSSSGEAGVDRGSSSGSPEVAQNTSSCRVGNGTPIGLLCLLVFGWRRRE